MRTLARIVSIGTLASLALSAGCDSILSPSRVTVELVNNGSFPIDVEIYIDEEQLIPKALLTTTGEKIDIRVEAGTTERFSRSCDDLQAIIINQANLVLVGDIGPNTDTQVFRDGDDFGCGDTITFTFTHPVLPITLDVATSFG